jgi:hypothetical protein
MNRAGKRIDVHIAAGGAHGFDDVISRFGGGDETPVRVIIRLHRQQRDTQRPVHRRLAGHRLVGVETEPGVFVFGPGLHDGLLRLKRSPSEQHAVRHGLAVRQRDFDGPNAVADLNRCGDDVAHLRLPVRTYDLAAIDHLGRAEDFNILAVFHRVHAEAHLRLMLGPESLYRESVQGGGAGAGINLGFDRGQA